MEQLAYIVIPEVEFHQYHRAGCARLVLVQEADRIGGQMRQELEYDRGRRP